MYTEAPRHLDIENIIPILMLLLFAIIIEAHYMGWNDHPTCCLFWLEH